MKKTVQGFVPALILMVSVCAWGAEKAEVKGMITGRTGETLIVKGDAGTVTVVLTDETVTRDDKGLFGLDKEHMSSVVLIPGLKVDIDGTSDEQGRVVAKTITVDGDDLETAEMVQSGLTPTAEQVQKNVQRLETHQQELAGQQVQLAAQKEGIEANQQTIAANRQHIQQNAAEIEENTKRFMALSEYDVKSLAVVKFDVGSTKISANGQNDLPRGMAGFVFSIRCLASCAQSA